MSGDHAPAARCCHPSSRHGNGLGRKRHPAWSRYRGVAVELSCLMMLTYFERSSPIRKGYLAGLSRPTLLDAELPHDRVELASRGSPQRFPQIANRNSAGPVGAAWKIGPTPRLSPTGWRSVECATPTTCAGCFAFTRRRQRRSRPRTGRQPTASRSAGALSPAIATRRLPCDETRPTSRRRAWANTARCRRMRPYGNTHRCR